MGSTFDAKKLFPDQLESLRSIHYVLTYNPNKNLEELSRYRENYLHNLEVNGAGIHHSMLLLREMLEDLKMFPELDYQLH